MRWSWKLVRIAGIDVFVHATFPLLIIWIAYSYWQFEHSVQAAISGVIFVLALFLCVVLHEFGHALTARKYGIGTKNITLLPIGGVASLEKLPEDPKQEIAVALAGPAVNIAIALFLYGGLRLTDTPVDVESFRPEEGFSWVGLMVVNLTLAIFNMIPAFPMDGGRVFRAILAFNMDRAKATRVAASAGQAFALFLGFMGLMFNPFLILIAMFVWIGASSESSVEHLKSLLAGKTVKTAMLTDFKTLSPTDPLARATELTLAGNQTDFPVVSNGVPVGMLSQSDLLRGLNETGEHAQVGTYASEQAIGCDINDPLENALEKLLKSRSKMIPVTDDGRLIGIIDFQNILEFINFQSATGDRGNMSAPNSIGTKW
jgi:Zn-dependent protease/predicted transcriptional regulator